MNTWKVILATMVIFGTGVITGGLLVRHSEHIRVPRPPRNAVVGRPNLPQSAGGVRLEFLRRAGRELGLTPEQHEKLDRIIRESQERTRKVMTPFLREELERTKGELREVLTAEQRQRFDQLLKQQQEQQQRTKDQRRPQPIAEKPTEGLPPAPPASPSPH